MAPAVVKSNTAKVVPAPPSTPVANPGPAASAEHFPENVPPLDPLPVVPTPNDNLPK